MTANPTEALRALFRESILFGLMRAEISEGNVDFHADRFAHRAATLPAATAAAEPSSDLTHAADSLVAMFKGGHEPLSDMQEIMLRGYVASFELSSEKRRAAERERLQGLETDAARYRLIRRGQHWSVVDGLGEHLRAEKLDAVIDAAMAARSAERGRVA